MTSTFFALAHDMMCIATGDGQYVAANPAWTRVLGWTVEQVEDTSFQSLVHPDDLSLVTGQRRDRAALAGELFEAPYVRMRAADGTYRLIDWRSTYDPLADEVLAAGRDVTEEVAAKRRLMSRERRMAELVAEQARDTERLLTRIAGDLHDSAVQHNVAALMYLEGGDDVSPAAADAAVQMRLSLEALRRVMSGIDAVDEGGEDPRADMHDIAASVAQRYGADIACDFGPLDRIAADVGATACRVAREGLVNACKHAKDGPISLAASTDADRLRITVRDAGCRLHDESMGTEHGLLYLEARVRSHNGHLRLDASPRGSTLIVEIPLSGELQVYPDGGSTFRHVSAMSGA